MIASPSKEYSKIWIRDAVYSTFGLEAEGKIDEVKKVMATLLDILLKHEYKIDWAIVEKPQHRHQYIHARYNPDTMEEYPEEWGNKQNDAIGLLLFKIGELEKKLPYFLRDDNDKRIIQKLVFYLNSVKYWKDKDNGVWEENEEVHASSVGACVAGLVSVQDIVVVPKLLIQKGQETLNKLLPRESETKNTDLALLSLIYPFNVVSDEQRTAILDNITILEREKGLIRYENDQYYNRNGEAEWTMGFPWLSIIYRDIDPKKSESYLKKANSTLNKSGEMPELYYSKTDEHNENTPLGWAESLLMVANKINN